MAVATDAFDGTENCELDHRALTEYMTVLTDGNDRAKRAPGLYTVTTQSGATYLVDPELSACECPDAEYRERRCKHIRRARFALGWRPLPEWIDPDDVDPDLGRHLEDGPHSEVP